MLLWMVIHYNTVSISYGHNITQPMPENSTTTDDVFNTTDVLKWTSFLESGNNTSTERYDVTVAPQNASTEITRTITKNKGILSKDMYDKITLFTTIILLPCVAVLGLTGNMFSFLVLTNYKNKQTVHDTLLALTISDSLYLMVAFVHWIFTVYLRVDPANNGKNYNIMLLYVSLFLSPSAGSVSNWLLVLLTSNRLVAMSCPFFNRKAPTRKYNIAVITFLFLFPFAWLSNHLVRFGLVETTNAANQTSLVLAQAPLYFENRELFDGLSRAGNIIFRFMPLGLVVALNIILTIVLRVIKRRRLEIRSPDAKATQKERITPLLITISVTYASCVAPGQFWMMAVTFLPGYEIFGANHYIVILISELDRLLSIFNASLNFLFYVFWSERFRSVLASNLHCRQRKPLETLMSTRATSSTRHTQSD